MNRREELKQIHERLTAELETVVRRLARAGLMSPESQALIHRECRTATKRIAHLVVKAQTQYFRTFSQTSRR